MFFGIVWQYDNPMIRLVDFCFSILSKLKGFGFQEKWLVRMCIF